MGNRKHETMEYRKLVFGEMVRPGAATRKNSVSGEIDNLQFNWRIHHGFGQGQGIVSTIVFHHAGAMQFLRFPIVSWPSTFHPTKARRVSCPPLQSDQPHLPPA